MNSKGKHPSTRKPFNSMRRRYPILFMIQKIYQMQTLTPWRSVVGATVLRASGISLETKLKRNPTATVATWNPKGAKLAQGPGGSMPVNILRLWCEALTALKSIRNRNFYQHVLQRVFVPFGQTLKDRLTSPLGAIATLRRSGGPLKQHQPHDKDRTTTEASSCLHVNGCRWHYCVDVAVEKMSEQNTQASQFSTFEKLGSHVLVGVLCMCLCGRV